MIRAGLIVTAVALVAALVGCRGSAPPVRYYKIALPDAEPAGQGEGRGILALERLNADAAYDDARIVYRESPYRLDYYHYHRWTAPPGLMVSDYLRMAYQQTGKFRSVVAGYSSDADAILSGRLMAIEEVNRTETEWLARIRLELRLRDARTGDLLWSQVLTETERLERNEPEALAMAMAAAMTRIVETSAPTIASHIPDS